MLKRTNIRRGYQEIGIYVILFQKQLSLRESEKADIT